MRKDGLRMLVVCYLCTISLFFLPVEKSEANEPNTAPTAVKRVSNELKNIILNRNFEKLEKYISKRHKIYWGVCYVDGDMYSEFSSFSEFKKMLISNSKNSMITVKGEPAYIDDLKVWRIKSEGWSGEEPFMEFNLQYEGKQVVIAGICTSSKPDPNEPLPKPAQLPRPGPRIFKNIHALHARIGEILRMKRFDALKAYAVNQSLTLKNCGENDAKEVSVSDVINFLIKNDTKSDLKFFALHSNLETENWGGEFPYITFQFSDLKGPWSWTGVSLCKTRPSEHERVGKIYYERY